jgi:hypothetical protein
MQLSRAWVKRAGALGDPAFKNPSLAEVISGDLVIELATRADRTKIPKDFQFIQYAFNQTVTLRMQGSMCRVMSRANDLMHFSAYRGGKLIVDTRDVLHVSAAEDGELRWVNKDFTF